MLKRILRYGFTFSTKKQQIPPKKYVLSQFPYPSGDLHLGHARVYYIGDAIASYYKLKNHEVIYPIGWDSFGLPAQNAAIMHGQNPKQWTQSNILRMKDQLHHLGVNFNWEMQLSTCSPEYYRWTQQIFVKMFKKGLAYKKMAQVNWDPVDKTVLANQQVDQNGCSWRSGAKVQQKMLNQWFFKITDFAEDLQQNLKNLEWVQKVKNMQRGWIDFKNGFRTKLKFQQKQKSQSQIEVFFKNIEDWDDAMFIIKKLKPTQEQNAIGQSFPEILGKATIPQTEDTILVVHSELEQSQSYILVTSRDMKQNEHYKQLATKYNLLSEKVSKVAKKLNSNMFEKVNQMKLKDWLISRQRFWGTPIPIIYCQICGTIPVSQEDLPVILPQWKNQGNPLLKEEFKKCQCPKCGNSSAERQTDTMDTFVDSSWYYLRFMDSKNKNKIFQKQSVIKMMPVDIYIGGIQHAIMHLLYARFIMRFINQQYNLTENCLQPFKQLVVQGLVKGKTLSLKQNGKYISQKDVEDGKYQIQHIEVTYQKMSKSKFNGLNPNLMVDKFGADALRISLFFANPPDRDIDFSEQIILNANKFLLKVQNLEKFHIENLSFILEQRHQKKQLLINEDLLKLKAVFEKMEISIQKRLMHTYVANAMQMFNFIKETIEKEKIQKQQRIKLFSIFVRVLKIIAPQLSEKLKKKLVSQFPLIVTQEQFFKWPSDQLFGQKIQIIIMKGKKMLQKDSIDRNLKDQQIIRNLKLQKMMVQEIKRQKKKFIVILKD